MIDSLSVTLFCHSLQFSTGDAFLCAASRSACASARYVCTMPRKAGHAVLQRRMPQRHLELERVPAVAVPVALEVHSERVAEPVRVSILHPGLGPQPDGKLHRMCQQLEQRVPAEGAGRPRCRGTAVR